MKTTKLASRISVAAATASLFCLSQAPAAVTVTVDPGAAWLGWMNVSNLPADGGAFQFGSPWGTPDLTAVFSGDVLTLGPNTIGDPDPYWYIGGGGPGAPGNKIMEANFYVEEHGPLAGQSLTFTWNVALNSLTPAHQAYAFIRDFAPDYSSSVDVFQELGAGGVSSISLDTINDLGRHVQYGFQMKGENVWVTDVAPFGVVQVTPEPGTSALLAGALMVFLAGRRRR